LFRRINLEKTVFVIISKSGQTVETISQYVFLKHYIRIHKKSWQHHFVFITDAKEGILRTEADQEQILTLPIPNGVGGRFSVLTPVGLLAARAMGVSIKSLVEGAATAAANPNLRQQAHHFAATQYQLYTQGTKLVVMLPYSVQLQEFARWFRQLWAESLGKNGKGIMPIQAFGPADQHSQEQFYTQGEPLQSVLYLRIENRLEHYPISKVDIADVAYLQGHSFHEIINVEQQASALALKKVGRPSATLSIEELDAYSLGQLFMFFELSVVYLAEMLGVNAFDQPGVEEGKQMIYALLGRKGFEAKRQEIEKLKKS
jgi:glucose-6-phosphate isomerase